jgi:hypothetical protein
LTDQKEVTPNPFPTSCKNGRLPEVFKLSCQTELFSVSPEGGLKIFDTVFAKLINHSKDMNVLTTEVDIGGKTEKPIAIDGQFWLMDTIVRFVEDPTSVKLPTTYHWLEKLGC